MSFHQIIKVIKYIEDHFDEEITAEEIENVSHYSYRNIQRVFKNLFKENIISFQRRLRLENAYKKIIYTDEVITDIAINVGYSNIQSFSKAFHKQFSISPTEARVKKENLFSTFINSEFQEIEHKTVYKEPVKIFYKSIKTPNYKNNEINLLWEEIEDKQEISHYESYGIIVDQPLITKHEHCRYEAGTNIPTNSTEKWASKEIFGGKYLEFIHFGSFETIENTYRSIYQFWLNNPRIKFAEKPVIEQYFVSDENEDLYKTYIYFPLKN